MDSWIADLVWPYRCSEEMNDWDLLYFRLIGKRGRKIIVLATCVRECETEERIEKRKVQQEQSKSCQKKGKEGAGLFVQSRPVKRFQNSANLIQLA